MAPRALPWLLLLLAALAVLATLWQPESVAMRLGLRDSVAERRQAAWERQMRASHRLLDASTPDGAVLLFGASTVQGLNGSRVAACHANFGIGGETAARLAERLPTYGSLARASAVIVGTGLNDVLRGTDERIAESYDHVLAAIPAGTPVILSAMQPLSPATEIGRARSAAVIRANAAARSACAKRTGCIFVEFLGPLPPSEALWSADGIHFGPAGYELWSRMLRQGLARAGVSVNSCLGSGDRP